MPAALVLPISGPYTGVWNAFSLGTQNDDGFILAGSYQGQQVDASDAYGMTLVEAIWRGLNWRIRFRGLEFNKPGILASMQAFGSTGAPSTTFTPILRNIGDRYSAYAQPLVLSAILGNPPSFVQTLTGANAIAAPQSNVEYLMTSKVREAPFEMVLLPYSAVIGSLTVNLAFTTT
jgi:hypothetical protein